MIYLFIFFTIAFAMGLLWIAYYHGLTPMSACARTMAVFDKVLPKSPRKVIELGCGWGTLAFYLSERYSKVPVDTYEVSPIPCYYAYIVQRVSRHPNLNIHWKDFFQLSLEGADLVVCYLYPAAMERLKEKLLTELKPGATVACNTYPIEGWEPDEVHKLDDFWRTKIYIYSISKQIELMQ